MVAAESIEFDGVRKHLDTRVADWGLDFSASSSDQKFALVANGPGRRLAARSVSVACDRLPVTAIVSTGFCGGLDSELNIGAIVIANRVMDSGSGRVYSTYPLMNAPPARSGSVVSIDRVAVTSAEKQSLALQGAIAVEMEAAGVAAEAERRSLPFYCIRVVSDTATETLPLDFNRYRKSNGRFDRPAIALAALMRPFTRIPALLRLQRNCRLASTQLGDFLAKCHF